MKVELENVKPMEIEKRSFEIITEELGDTQLVPGTELIEALHQKNIFSQKILHQKLMGSYSR